jgi:hypothetical protein
MKRLLITLITAGVLVCAWVLLVIFNKAEVGPLVQFIQYALTGLAAHSLTMIDPKKEQP